MPILSELLLEFHLRRQLLAIKFSHFVGKRFDWHLSYQLGRVSELLIANANPLPQ